MIKAGIIGATGFTGIELVRILAQHPQVKISCLTSQTYEGLHIEEVYPHLRGIVDNKLTSDPHQAVEMSDVVFTALPHGHSSGTVREAYEAGKKVVDLGADFRLDSLDDYEKWYKTEHKAKDLLSKAVYGLPEVRREEIKKASIIANPGCFPTSVILALFPLLKEGVISTDDLIVDSKTGVSGAGRKLDVAYLYSTVNESMGAYGVAAHRHTPEMEQELKKIAGKKLNILFSPHLLPVTRGLLSTIYAKLKEGCGEKELRKIYEEAYVKEPFVKLLPLGVWPKTKWVLGTNNCYVNFTVYDAGRRVVITSVIDNLIKGASGQAVQNMNLMFGFEENEGLRSIAIYP